MSAKPKPAALDPFEARFARAQTEWALWVDITSNRKRKPSKVFRVRVKHLLEFDRAEPTAKTSGPYSGMAFSDYRSEGQGDHAFFSVYDALLLRLGLSLLDLGFKRKEVVLMLRDQRDGLRQPMAKLLNQRATTLAASQKLFADYDPRDPEQRVILVAPRVEAAADYVEDDETRVRVCFGMEDLTDVIADVLNDKLILLDVGLAAYMLPSLLLQAPASQRLRQPK